MILRNSRGLLFESTINDFRFNSIRTLVLDASVTALVPACARVRLDADVRTRANPTPRQIHQ